MIKKINNCQLEIDTDRGVLYVHKKDGNTAVRICKIPPIIINSIFIDVVFDRILGKKIKEIKIK